MDTNELLQAGCSCGAMSYQTTEKPERVVVCHCKYCYNQKCLLIKSGLKQMTAFMDIEPHVTTILLTQLVSYLKGRRPYISCQF